MSAELSSVFWMVVVIAAIPATLWFLRRTPLGAQPVPGAVRTVAVLPLSGSQRLVTVEVGRGEHRLWLVLGVTPQAISHLHTLVPQDDGSGPPPTPAAVVGPLLQRLRRNGNDDKA
ncbi:MAG: flagellar biosynthetic protein FliO [Rubrivivax sp.]|nr:flagellar biosynthetic protein FliO [Rubrivivax sp.]